MQHAFLQVTAKKDLIDKKIGRTKPGINPMNTVAIKSVILINR